MRNLSLLAISLLVSAHLVACDNDSSGPSEPPVPAETTSAVNNSVQLALTEAAQSFEFLNDSDLADDLFDLLPGDSEDCGIVAPMPVDEFGEPMETDEEFIDPCGEDGDSGDGFQVDFQEMANEMAEWVAEEVLTESNVEEVSGNSVIYLLPNNLVCDALEQSDEGEENGSSESFGGRDSSDAPFMDDLMFCESVCGEPECLEGMDAPDCESYMEQIALCMESCMGGGEDEDMGMEVPPMDFDEEPNDEDEDQSCEEMFDEVPLRLRVTAAGAGHNIDLLVGAKKSNPISAYVAPTELSFELDIEGSMESLETLAEAAGEDAPELPSNLEGRVKLGLKKNATENYTVALSIVKALHLALEVDGGEMSLQLGVSEPTIAITADGAAEALAIDVDLAALDVSVPGSVFGSETCTYDDMTGEEYCESDDGMDGDLDLHLGGASLSMSLATGSDDTVSVTNAGLGDSTTTVSYDGQQIIGLDLNPNHGRRFDLSVTSLEDIVELAVDPALVLQVALDLAKAPDMAEDAPEFMLDEDMTISLTGSSPAVSMGDHGMRVESGTLLMSSTSTEDVIVEAGMCMEMDGGDDTDVLFDEESGEEVFMPEEPEDEGDEHPFSAMKAAECE